MYIDQRLANTIKYNLIPQQIMSKGKLMKMAYNSVFSQLVENIPREKAESIEVQIDNEMAKKLGNDWLDLPITGPYTLVFFLVLNKTLLPMGITPAKITDAAINLAKEAGIDEKVGKVLNDVKDGITVAGEYSEKKLQGVTNYLKKIDSEHNLSETVIEELSNTKEFISSGLGKGKSFISNIFNKKEEEKE